MLYVTQHVAIGVSQGKNTRKSRSIDQATVLDLRGVPDANTAHQ